MKIHVLIAAAMLVTGMNLHAEPEIKGTATELSQYLNGVPRTVNLTGEAEVKVPADRALISVRVVTENKLLQEASRVNQELRAKMLKALAEKGIPAERIQASKFSSTPKYGMFGEKAKSYRVENVVKVTAQDEKEFQAVANLVDVTPEFRYDGIEFEHSDKDSLKAKALAQAIDKATEKKRLYEEKLGVKLFPKQFIEDSVAPITVERATKEYEYSGSRHLTPVSPATETDMQTSFGELIFTARVTVTYSLENK